MRTSSVCGQEICSPCCCGQCLMTGESAWPNLPCSAIAATARSGALACNAAELHGRKPTRPGFVHCTAENVTFGMSGI